MKKTIHNETLIKKYGTSIEAGFTAISNPVLDYLLKVNISGRAFQFVICLLRHMNDQCEVYMKHQTILDKFGYSNESESAIRRLIKDLKKERLIEVRQTQFKGANVYNLRPLIELATSEYTMNAMMIEEENNKVLDKQLNHEAVFCVSSGAQNEQKCTQNVRESAQNVTPLLRVVDALDYERKDETHLNIKDDDVFLTQKAIDHDSIVSEEANHFLTVATTEYHLPAESMKSILEAIDFTPYNVPVIEAAAHKFFPRFLGIMPMKKKSDWYQQRRFQNEYQPIEHPIAWLKKTLTSLQLSYEVNFFSGKAIKRNQTWKEHIKEFDELYA